MEAALEVTERACSPFLQWRPEALFFRAELLERVGRTDDARGVYKRVLSEVHCLERALSSVARGQGVQPVVLLFWEGYFVSFGV